MARVLGAPVESIAFVKNTTEGLNIASHALDLAPGDNIVITDMEHRANLWVWDHWRERGVTIRTVQNRDGRLPLEAFMEKIDGRTRVVATAWVVPRRMRTPSAIARPRHDADIIATARSGGAPCGPR